MVLCYNFTDSLKYMIKSNNIIYKGNGFFEFTGGSIDELLEQASSFFSVSVDDLDFEVVNSGRYYFGFGSSFIVISINSNSHSIKNSNIEGEFYFEELDDESLSAQKINNINDTEVEGTINFDVSDIKITKNGIYLIVRDNKDYDFDSLMIFVKELFARRKIIDYNNNLVNQIVRERKSEYIRIGNWVKNDMYDSKLNIHISDDKMKVYIQFSEPIMTGRDLDIDDIYDTLEANNIIYGIENKVIENIMSQYKRQYNTPILIVQGTDPVEGADAYINYNFNTDDSSLKLLENEKGFIDYKHKEIDNVEKGVSLAYKVVATDGVNGSDVFGKEIYTTKGNDIDLNDYIGKNVIVSENNLEILSNIDGMVTLKSNKVNVDPLYIVKSDVDLNVGNIDFIGSVLIKGNVNDGFKIRASSDINIEGFVGKADIEADGNITVRNGISGKHEGLIKSHKGSVYAKFISQAKVDVADSVIVSEEITHSYVNAGNKVLCFHGKRGSIVGGIIRALNEVNCKYIGTPANAVTVVEVGYDYQVKDKFTNMNKELEEYNNNIDKLSMNISVLENRISSSDEEDIKHTDRINNFISLKKQLELQKKDLEFDLVEIEKYLSSLDAIGIISAKKIIYSGVYINIKNLSLLIRREQKNVSFMINKDDSMQGVIKPFPYQSSSESK